MFSLIDDATFDEKSLVMKIVLLDIILTEIFHKNNNSYCNLKI